MEGVGNCNGEEGKRVGERKMKDIGTNFHGAHGVVDGLVFDGVVLVSLGDFADAGGVDELDGAGVSVEPWDGDGVAGEPRGGTGNDSFFLEKGVDECGFADVLSS